MEKKHIVYVDILRIAATVGVIILHVAAQNWGMVELDSLEWKVFHISDSMVRWCVPMFVMISGLLFLNNDKELSMEKLYKTHILRIITAFAFWSAIYAVDAWFHGVSLKMALISFIEGKYHLWFLYMIVGLYIITPVLRKITDSKNIVEYFLAVGFVFSFFIPRAIHFLSCLQIQNIGILANALKTAYSYMYFYLTGGYIVCFVLGFYLYKYEIGRTMRRLFYGLGVVSFVMTIMLTTWHSNMIGQASQAFYSYFSINVLGMCIGIFVFAKYELSKIHFSEKALKAIKHLSKCTFGMYLVHPLILQILAEQFQITTLSFHPFIAVVFIVAVVTLVSFLISDVLNRIPILKKYIV